MQLRLSLRTQFLLSFWTVLILALLLPSLYFSRSLQREILSESEKKAIQQLDLLQWLMVSQHGYPDPARLQDFLVQTGGRLGVRITYVAEGGGVVADSGVDLADVPGMESHAGRPEIIKARSGEVGIATRHSATLDKDLLYVAKSVSPQGGIPPGVLRLAVPFSDIKKRVEFLDHVFVIVILLTFLATSFLIYALTRHLDRSVQVIIRAARAIGAGDFSQRIHFHPGHEYFPLAHSIHQMAERLETYVRTVNGQKQQLAAILDGMEEGVILLDARGKIHAVNRAMKRMAPSLPQIVGRRPLEVVRSTELQEACDRMLARMKGPRGGGPVTPERLQVLIEPGHVYDVHIVPVEGENRDYGAIVVFHDISELKRLEKVRRDFVANVSHELRTPLTSIKGYAETLLSSEPQDPENARSFLQVILKNANHMTEMANDLLDLARLEENPVQAPLVPVNVEEVLLGAWKVCAQQAASREVRLDSRLPGEPVWVKADFDQLLQVFRNLIENAIRYSPQGEAVSVTCETREGTVTLGIQDQGMGIPKRDQQRIFERFYRVEKHRQSGSGSTGLGLAICRHIILRHGGEIWVESPPKGGSRGTVVFFTLLAASPK